MGVGPEAALTRARSVLAALLAAACLAACGASDDEPRAGATTTASPRPTAVDGGVADRGRADPGQADRPERRERASYSDWELGAEPLPLRPDGLGRMRPTPEPLRVRRFPTTDLLPPPPDAGFQSSIGPVTPAIRRRMGASWSPRCPVGLDDLRYLRVTFRGFDGEAHTGELVVAATEAVDVVSVFRALFAAEFPIEEMRLPTTADLEAHPTGDGNNTAGLVCRPMTGGGGWSAHAYGLAIDVNPFQNPYRRGDGAGRVVLPELASSYLDRSWVRPGMILPGSVAVREFARIGWSWGGAWTTLEDYQHFSATSH